MHNALQNTSCPRCSDMGVLNTSLAHALFNLSPGAFPDSTAQEALGSLRITDAVSTTEEFSTALSKIAAKQKILNRFHGSTETAIFGARQPRQFGKLKPSDRSTHDSTYIHNACFLCHKHDCTSSPASLFGVCSFNQHRFRKWLGALSAPTHFMNQWRLRFVCNMETNPQSNNFRNSYIFIEDIFR